MQLEINGRNWQLVWGMGALEELCNELNFSLTDIDVAIMNNETAVLNRLVYCALRNGAECEDTPTSLTFNYKKFLQWLDEQPDNTGKSIMDDFMNSKLSGRTMQQRFDEIIERLNAIDSEETKKVKKKNIPSGK